MMSDESIEIRPSPYWTATRVSICHSTDCIFNIDAHCNLKIFTMGSEGRCMSYVTEVEPQYRTKRTKNEWLNTPAYKAIGKSKGVNNRIHITLRSRYERGLWNGSINQLQEIIDGDRHLRGIGPKSRKHLKIALGLYLHRENKTITAKE